jgi:protein-arginine kinase activator protein McsA
MNGKETCVKHGEVFVWIVCRHVGEGSADTIIFSENQDALCFECARNFKNLTELDVVAMCVECLKDFTAKLMIDAKTFANLKNRVKGIEYLKGKRGSTSESEEIL